MTRMVVNPARAEAQERLSFDRHHRADSTTRGRRATSRTPRPMARVVRIGDHLADDRSTVTFSTRPLKSATRSIGMGPALSPEHR